MVTQAWTKCFVGTILLPGQADAAPSHDLDSRRQVKPAPPKDKRAQFIEQGAKRESLAQRSKNRRRRHA